MENEVENLVKSSNLLNILKAEKNNKGGSFTIKSLKTGKEYTYIISRKNFKGKWYTHVSVEYQYQNYNYLGTYFKGKIYRKGSVVTSPSAISIAFVLDKVENNKFEYLDRNIQIYHTGSCMRCGRQLTDSNSISMGLGPTCSSY